MMPRLRGRVAPRFAIRGRGATALAALGLGLAGLGCAATSAGVDPAMPAAEVPVPEAWSGTAEASSAVEPDRNAREGQAVAGAWWRAFGDAELNQLVEIAVSSNRDLESASARLDAALAQARIAGAARKGEASVATQASRARQNFIGLPIPGAEGRVLSNTSTTLGVALNVSWEADLWGRLGDGARAARARAEAAAWDLEAARLSITGQTAKAWFAYLEALEQTALAETTLGNRNQVRERVERRYRQGLRSPLDLRIAIADESDAASRLAARRRQKDALGRQLEVLLARDPGALEIVRAAAPALPPLPPAPAPGLPAEVLRRRPDLEASEFRLAAAGLDVAAARKLLYPRLTLTGSTGTRSQEPEDLLSTDFSVWSLAAGLLQPLFQGGRLRAGVALSEAARRDLLARHENAVIRAVTEVEAELAKDRLLGDQHRALATAKEAWDASEALARDRYFSGLADYLALLASQDRATVAASQLLEIDRLRLEQRVDLYLSLGGASEDEDIQ